jgi:hypothetical protein
MERIDILLASFERYLHLVLARSALQSQYDLLGSLCLFVEHGLGLATVSGLLTIVSSLSLGV